MEEKKARQIYAASHLILTAILLGAITIFVKKLWIAILVFIGGYLFIPMLIIGMKEVGFYKITNKYEDDLGIEFYGPIRVIIKWGFRVIVILGVFVSTIVWLPFHVSCFFGGTVVAILLIDIIIYPLVEDVVHLFAKEDQTDRLTTITVRINEVAFILCIVLAIGSFIYVSKKAPKELNLSECAKEYVVRNKDWKQHIDQLSYEDATIQFKKGSSLCWARTSGTYIIREGLEKTGEFTIELEYNFFTNKWTARKVREEGMTNITSPLTYIGQGEEDIDNYKRKTTIELTFEKFNSDTGEGNGSIRITDIETGADLFSTTFVSSTYISDYKITTESALDIGYFSINEFEFEFDGETIHFETASDTYKLTIPDK